MEPSVDFGRIDCSLMHDLCDSLNVQGTPSMLFLPAEGVAYNNTYPRLPTVDSIVLYLNELLGTHRIVGGGLDELYGLDPALNAYASQFVQVATGDVCEWQGDADRRKEIMRVVKRERKQHANSAVYYAVMKDVGLPFVSDADSRQWRRHRIRPRERDGVRDGGTRDDGRALRAAGGEDEHSRAIRADRAHAQRSSGGLARRRC